MKLEKRSAGWVYGLVMLLVGIAVAGPAQEEFTRPPAEGQQRARDAVAAPHLEADEVAPELVFGLMAQYRKMNLDRKLPDFRTYRDIPTRKVRFFSFLLPLVQAENARLTAIRTRLSYIHDHVRWGRRIARRDQQWLAQVATVYRLQTVDPARSDFWTEVFERVDGLPEDLVLVQAANESAWGTSRFAREGNNLFGQWCYRQGCGIVPAGRPAGATYEVARYVSVGESVGSYMHNLNTGTTYQLLRELRARMRAEGEDPDAVELAAGLMDYSERGLAYVNELRAMLRHNASIMADVRERDTKDGNS